MEKGKVHKIYFRRLERRLCPLCLLRTPGICLCQLRFKVRSHFVLFESQISLLQVRPKEGKDETPPEPVHTGITTRICSQCCVSAPISIKTSPISLLVADTSIRTTTLTMTLTPRRSLLQGRTSPRKSKAAAAITRASPARAVPASTTSTTTSPSLLQTLFSLSIRSSGKTPLAISSFILVGKYVKLECLFSDIRIEC